MARSQQKPTQDMGSGSIPKLMLNLAIPAVVAQLINMLYNIVDRIYIGHMPEVGMTALTGIGLCFPVIYLIGAFTMLVAQGGAPRAAIAMGEGNNEKAEKIMGSCFTCLIGTAIALTALFWIFGEQLLWIFGCSEETIVYALPYMRIYSSGSIFVMMALGMNLFVTTQGFTTVSMRTVLIGAVSNIILDPIFIYAFDMGVQGAALATVISQAVSGIWVVRFLTGKRTTLRLRRGSLRPSWTLMAPVLALGVSPFVMQSRYMPRAASATAVQMRRPIFLPRKIPSRGTITMYSALMKPALPTVVSLTPNCCRVLPPNRQMPQQMPPISRSL